MRKITILVFVFGIITSAMATGECGTAYQDATYALEHTEKALQANNIEHLKQYSRRALEAIQKVYSNTEKCRCTEANNSSYDALEHLEKSLEKEKFEVARYYVKSALSSTKSILISLDLCTEPDPTYDLIVDENNLISQEQELLAQQQALLKKQKALEAQLQAQKELQAKISREKEIKLAEQKKIKFEAETNLLELENVINRIIRVMECGKSEPVSADYIRTLEELEVESINATKTYYTQKAREMADKLIVTLADCN